MSPHIHHPFASAETRANEANELLSGPDGPLRFSFGTRLAAPFGTVTEAFYHHAREHPEAIAAKDLSAGSAGSAREIDYASLARRSRRLAAQLRELGVQPGDRIPLVVKRSIEMLVGIMAILSCGAQYVPLDAGVVPDSALRFVLQQSQQTRGAGAPVALCLASTEYRLLNVSEDSCKTVVIPVLDDRDPDGEVLEKDDADFQDLATPDGGCYVIYTSGTTGTPKGVDVTHRNVTNIVCLAPGRLGIEPGMRVGQVLNIGFDMAAWEMLGALCNGGTLVIRGSDWLTTLREIDVLICTPSILSQYNPESLPNLKVVATAGEPSNQRLADLWAAHGIYYNCCGPTETTIVNTMHEHIQGVPLSVGAPTPNNSVYILGENLEPVALGEAGVMWAGGFGVSRGYVGMPEKTSERYLLDKFANDGSMMYNTGDLGRWNPNGAIDILGREDDQIKIKGFRVELDGVSASLGSAPGVKRAVALLIGREIHGFVTPRACDLDALIQHMAQHQPYYAAPTQFHLLDDLPYTANGKMDKKALRERAAANQPSPSSSNNNNLAETTSATTVSESSGSTHSSEKPDLSRPLPDKTWPKTIRNLVYRVFIVYRFLFSVVGIANAAALITVLATNVPKEWLATITAINLAFAVLIRQDLVINALYTICCSVPKSWPLPIRASCAKIYHLGGVHSGAAFCAGAWLLASNLVNAACSVMPSCSPGSPGAPKQQSTASTVLSWILTALFCVMFTLAWPPLRKRRHNLFERTHRFVGWTMLGLFWAQTVVSANDTKPAGTTLGDACLHSAPLWLLTAATCSIALPWLFLRKVPVDAEVLSDHAVRLHFDYTVPVNGSFTRISTRPLLEWHSFATVPAPEAVAGRPAGYSLVVSNGGDWTGALIRSPPTALWVRGLPACGVMRIATLFRRVVVVATGSGIGPCLGHLQAPSCPTQLIWSTPNPEKTFGQGMIDAVRDKIPDAVIHDTRRLGRPDLVMMAYNLAKSFGAEAVIIIANEKISKKVVYGLETRGMHAYGAIWDS
ncbi:AMP-binding enzyme [Chaetomium sp. MPI-SDFR-AT-0129]|nr:AMP-binding enzyme [Chaetomium sp. MPI-SDFR-AT-0129]